MPDVSFYDDHRYLDANDTPQTATGSVKKEVNTSRQAIKMIRTVFCGESVIALMILLAISMVGVKAQNANQNRKATALDSDCVKVSMTADSNRLEKRNPILLRVRIENLCDRKIEFLEPSFTIDKSILSEKLKFGDRRGARIIRTKTSELDNTAKSLDSGKYLELAFDTNELRWMDSMSSIEVFEDLFTDHELKTGSYHLYCTVVVFPISEQHYKEKRGKVTRILSNKIEVLFEEEVNLSPSPKTRQSKVENSGS